MTLTRHAIFAAISLLLGGCGGSSDHAGDLPLPTPAAGRGTAAQAVATAPSNTPLAPAVTTLTLRDWLARLAARHSLTVSADPAIAQLPVTSALPAQAAGDDVVAALADFDVLLGYARRGTVPPALTMVGVYPRGAFTTPRLPLPAAQHAQPAAAVEVDPEQVMLRVQQHLASGDAEVRSAAMVRSFELEAPLPAMLLVSALQGDASGKVRLFALMALARHPAVEPQQLRALAQAARHDADAAVRAHAVEVQERLDAAERVFE